MTYLSKWVARKMRMDVFEKLMHLPVRYYHHNTAGDIISRVSYDVDVVSTCIATDVAQIMTSLVTVIGSFLMMVYLSPTLSVIALVTIPISVGYTTFMRKKVRPRYSRRSKSYGSMNGFVEEMLSGEKNIQAYAYEDAVCQRFDKVNTEAADAYYDAEFYSCSVGPTMGFINNLSLSLIAILGTVLYMNGAVALDTISSFVLYSRKFSGPINEFANVVNELFSALSAAERIFSLLDEAEEPAEPQDMERLTDVKGSVELRHVKFGYQPEKTILHDLSLKVEPGKTVAIVVPPAPEKPPSSVCSCAITMWTAEKSALMTVRSAAIPVPPSGESTPWFSRTPGFSAARFSRTSPTESRTPPWMRWLPLQKAPISTPSSCACPTDTRP